VPPHVCYVSLLGKSVIVRYALISDKNRDNYEIDRYWLVILVLTAHWYMFQVHVPMSSFDRGVFLFQVHVPMSCSDRGVSWEFATDSRDIGFSVTYESSEPTNHKRESFEDSGVTTNQKRESFQEDRDQQGYCTIHRLLTYIKYLISLLAYCSLINIQLYI